MGQNALIAGAFARAVEWFEEASVLAGLEANQTVHQDLVLQYLDTAIRRVKRSSNYSLNSLDFHKMTLQL